MKIEKRKLKVEKINEIQKSIDLRPPILIGPGPKDSNWN